MKNFYGKDERKFGKLKPKTELPTELKRKQQQEQKHSLKQKDKDKK